MANIRIKDLTTSVTHTAVDDFEEIDGATNGSRKRPSYVRAEQIVSRASADYLQSDGATTNRRIETVYGALGAVAGSDLTEVDYVFDVPTSNPSSAGFIFAWASSNTNVNGAWSLCAYLYSNGGLYIDAAGATPATDFRSFGYAGFRAAYSGRRVRLTVAFTGNSTTAPVVYLDGADISAAFTATDGAGTDPNWVSASLVTTYHIAGTNWPAGYFRPGRPVNRKYAQADVDFVQATGRLPYADAAGGGLYYTSDFAASTGWALVPTTTISGGKLNLVSTFAAGAPVETVMRAGRRYRFTITVDSITAGNAQYYNGAAYVNFASAAGTYTVEFTAAADAVQFNLRSSGGDAVCDTFLFYGVGALSDPIIQPCLVLDDATANNKASVVVGFAPVTVRKDWRIPAFVDMSSTGNKQLLGAAVFETPTKQAIDTIESTCAGTPTFSVGDGTTATKYTASVAHTAVRLRETVSANFPADSAKTGIYANVTALHASSGAELIIIRGHRE